MKFAYVDESGSSGDGDVFVMAGLLIDAYRLRKYTSNFDRDLLAFRARHPGAPRELKTKRLINGTGGWNKVPADERKQFVTDMCDTAVSCSKIYGFGMSFGAFERTCTEGRYVLPCARNYWALVAMFISSLIQKKMQGQPSNKGLTVLIFDDNRADMPKVSEGLYLAEPWFDGLYQKTGAIRGKKQWVVPTQEERFDQIINTAFAIKSEHSSLIQVADAVCYVYRRHLELSVQAEAWTGEKRYFAGLATKIESAREHLGHTPKAECLCFYKAIKHPAWEI